MLTNNVSSLKVGVTTMLSSAMMLASTIAMTAEAQSGRVKARTDRGVATAIKGPDGGRAARARGCNQVEGGQTCGSTSGAIAANGALAGRASVSEFEEDGSFDRDASAYALTQYGEGTRTFYSEINPDGTARRMVDGYAESDTGVAARDSLITVDENGNVIRYGAASGTSDLATFSTDGSGTYSYESGLDYARASQAAAAGEYGMFSADSASSFDQETGFQFDNSRIGSVSNENGDVQGQSNVTFSQSEGLAVDNDLSGTNADGATLDANVSYTADGGLERSVICTNSQGETVPCAN